MELRLERLQSTAILVSLAAGAASGALAGDALLRVFPFNDAVVFIVASVVLTVNLGCLAFLSRFDARLVARPDGLLVNDELAPWGAVSPVRHLGRVAWLRRNGDLLIFFGETRDLEQLRALRETPQARSIYR